MRCWKIFLVFGAAMYGLIACLPAPPETPSKIRKTVEKQTSVMEKQTEKKVAPSTSKIKQKEEIWQILADQEKLEKAEKQNLAADVEKPVEKPVEKSKEVASLKPAEKIEQPETPVENAVFIQLAQEKSVTDYPLQIARPFIPGEIREYPQVIWDGSVLKTQADVKCRWADGSVKHAILSFVVPNLRSATRYKITFRNQKTGLNEDFETKESMLIHYNFDAQIKIQGDNTAQKVSARDMLKQAKFTYWQKGPICTSIILADHSEQRAYDLGCDSQRSVRPIFHASFWPGLKKVRVRFIGEIANTQVLQDQLYELELSLGAGRYANVVYQKDFLQHQAMSRWTKVFWMGEAVPLVSIDHNLRYLSATKFLPHYNPKAKIVEKVLEDYSISWQSAPKDLFSEGNWTKYMPSTGGRWEIGPHPDWVIYWLYSGDSRLYEMSVGHAELAGAWPMHLREGRSTQSFDFEKKEPALGKVISLNARPSIFLTRLDFQHTAPEDKIMPVTALKENSWVPDMAHQSDPYSALYTLTGDFWYLEQMYFWAAWSAGAYNGSEGVWYGRGPKGTGGIQHEIRSEAWCFRNRVRTAFLAPDDSIEKAYFTKLVEDAIALWEGQRDIRGTSYEKTPAWIWGNTIGKGIWEDLEVPKLHFWQKGNEGHAQDDSMNGEITSAAIAPWQINFMMFSLGHAEELGYKTHALLLWLGELVVQSLNHPQVGLPKFCSYRLPSVSKKDKQFFATYEEMAQGFSPTYNFQEFFQENLQNPVHGYTYILVPSVAMAKDAGVPGSAAAWAAVEKTILATPVLMYYPKWAIFPRGGK